MPADQQVELEAVAAEGVQEAWPDVDADGVDEEDQPEFAHEMQDVVVDPGAEMREEQAGEEYAGGAETDAAYFELAEEDAGEGGQPDPEGGGRRAGAEEQVLQYFHCLGLSVQEWIAWGVSRRAIRAAESTAASRRRRRR